MPFSLSPTALKTLKPLKNIIICFLYYLIKNEYVYTLEEIAFLSTVLANAN